jgi:hypothetical protein
MLAIGVSNEDSTFLNEEAETRARRRIEDSPLAKLEPKKTESSKNAPES